ncbi:hypothetical protein L596_000568 [Steinernema carpocapsae]|uniref:Uncharacterized protein n=1 Tax=Steinernema carpocapsae TaxID=34508 RepID=A0A4U8UKW3_STECR|nr:hypothetical protein L596_000568 [Steinernema carpocapsae]
MARRQNGGNKTSRTAASEEVERFEHYQIKQLVESLRPDSVLFDVYPPFDDFVMHRGGNATRIRSPHPAERRGPVHKTS